MKKKQQRTRSPSKRGTGAKGLKTQKQQKRHGGARKKVVESEVVVSRSISAGEEEKMQREKDGLGDVPDVQFGGSPCTSQPGIVDGVSLQPVSHDHYHVENDDVNENFHDTAGNVHAEAQHGGVGDDGKKAKKKYTAWSREDRHVILEKYQEFKNQKCKTPVAATLNYFNEKSGTDSPDGYPDKYKMLRESTIRTWVKQSQGDVVAKRPGRPPVLQASTMKALEGHILSRMEKREGTRVSKREGGQGNGEEEGRKGKKHSLGGSISSKTLIPELQAVIRQEGEGDKLDNGDIAVSPSWVNTLCRRVLMRHEETN